MPITEPSTEMAQHEVEKYQRAVFTAQELNSPASNCHTVTTLHG